MKIQSLSDLNTIKEQTLVSLKQYKSQIRVCMGSGCDSSGNGAVRDVLVKALKSHNLENEVRIVETGCIGFCGVGPLLVVDPEGVLYQQLSPGDAEDIVEQHIRGGVVVQRLLYTDPNTGKRIARMQDIPFYKHQTKNILKRCGVIDPTKLEEYIATDGYQALHKAISTMTPERVVAEVKDSGLRGRGGAGFPVGLKWQLTQQAKGDVRYIVANADEGDPGAFMDRYMIAGDPHRVVEGMAIAGYAIGAKQGYIYIRAEYPLAVERLRLAISQAREAGLLGNNILGSNCSFDIEIRVGAGAFVCGEETALLASVEGKRGTPRPRPPFPATEGLWRKPTVLNNVESLANVPLVIQNGAAWYKQLGTERSKGTKMYALAGDTNNTGLVEVPIGTEIGKIIYDIGGGCKKGKKFKAVQSGGPSGGCIPQQYLNIPVDYESLKQLDAIMGSGGLVVMDEDKCMVDIARFFLEFCLSESCGKCTPCREGFKAMLGILNRITTGQGREGDVELLRDLALTVKDSALCGLGQTGPNPILSTIRHFRNEYDAHVRYKSCPAGVCEALFESPCANACPAGLDTHGYVALVSQGRFREAYDLITERMPFPGICGRVCTHVCESKCRRGDLDDPVSLRLLKRTVADYELEMKDERSTTAFPIQQKNVKVAIVGAGPAGLTAAYNLARMGYDTTIFEASNILGGMMAMGIPAYRLPRDILKVEIDNITRLGVKVEANRRLGKDFTVDDLFKNDYKAVFVSVGAWATRGIGLPGENLENVYQGIRFLADANTGKVTELKGQVVIIGGGNVAIDAARSVVRMGADKVRIIYRRRREEMPATGEEIEEAEREGVEFNYLVNPVKIVGDETEHPDGIPKRAKEIVCTRMELKEFDTSGRRSPVPVAGSEFSIRIDALILATGQFIEAEELKTSGLKLTRQSAIEVNPDTLETNVRGVYAGGDCVSGPATVVEAVSAGLKAASSIDRFLGGKGIISENVRKSSRIGDIFFDLEAEIKEKQRVPVKHLPLTRRSGNFSETEEGYSKEEATEEAQRCLHCDRKAEEET